MARPRLTLKLGGQGQLLVAHVDLDAPLPEATFREIVAAVTERMKRTDARPATRKNVATREDE